ncbi:MAG: CDP-diacylglycerol--glycerol-3-phosphate 3-phosphatidyltransferase [Rickettsiales bacterium]|nr:CDP-diacylglycerol--glycerol-3-phosphate 3-phosphatidyltransferase [Rickettsiales bacterium]
MYHAIPNWLTFSRILVLPVLVASFYIDRSISHWVAAGLFAFASITDFFDGYLARRWKSQSSLGRFLDPIADKLLVVTALMMLVHTSVAMVVPSMLIVCREIMVSGLREFLAELNVGVPVSRLAKMKTGMQMLAIFLLLLGDRGADWQYTELVGNLVLWLSAILTLVTGYAYLKAGLLHMSMPENKPE